MDIVLSPLFVTVVALGLVGLTMFNAINELGTSKVYDEKFYAVRNGLVRDAIQSIPKDTNLQVEVTIPDGFGFEFKKHYSRVYHRKDEGYKFYNTHSIPYKFTSTSFKSGTERKPEKNNPLIHYRIGNRIGIESLGQNPSFKPDLRIPYCEKSDKRLRVSFEEGRKNILDFSSVPVKLVEGDVSIFVQSGNNPQPILKIYVSPTSESAHIACFIIQNMFEVFPQLKGAASIPVNVDLVPNTDFRKQLTGTSILLELSGITVDTSSKKAALSGAVFSGVREYGLE